MIEVGEASELNALGLRPEENEEHKSYRNWRDDDREGERIITAIVFGVAFAEARRLPS
jgi:hypothetical protein